MGQGAGGDDDTGGNGELPFTGPNDTLLPAGTALLVAGLALVGVTRYGPGTPGASSRPAGGPHGSEGRLLR